MNQEKRRELYLAQAKAADEKADKETDLALKEGFRKVASGYRAVARDT